MRNDKFCSGCRYWARFKDSISPPTAAGYEQLVIFGEPVTVVEENRIEKVYGECTRFRLNGSKMSQNVLFIFGTGTGEARVGTVSTFYCDEFKVGVTIR